MFCELSMNLKISLTEQLWNIIVAVYSNYSEIYIYSKWVESTFWGGWVFLFGRGIFFLVLRIWDIYPRSKFFPSWIPGSASENLSILTQINGWFQCSRKYDQGCSPQIRIPDPDFLPIPDPWSRSQKGTRSRILNPDPQHCVFQQKCFNYPDRRSRIYFSSSPEPVMCQGILRRGDISAFYWFPGMIACTAVLL
jgi:hypothetical protein